MNLCRIVSTITLCIGLGLTCKAEKIETWRMLELAFESETDYAESDGSLRLPEKPDTEDWTLTIVCR